MGRTTRLNYKETTCVHRTNTMGSLVSAGAGPVMAIAQSSVVMEYLNISQDSQCYGGLTTAATTIPPGVTCLAGALDVKAYANQTDLFHARFNSAYEKIGAATASAQQFPASKALDALRKIISDELKQKMAPYEEGCYQQKWVHISTAILVGGLITFAVPPAATVLPCLSASIAPTVQGGLVTVLGSASSFIQNRAVREYDKLSRYLHKKVQELEVFAQLTEKVLPYEDHADHAKFIDILNDVAIRIEEAQESPDALLTMKEIYDAALAACEGILARQHLKGPTTQPMGRSRSLPARQQTCAPVQSPEAIEAVETVDALNIEILLPGQVDDEILRRPSSTTGHLLSQLGPRSTASFSSDMDDVLSSISDISVQSSNSTRSIIARDSSDSKVMPLDIRTEKTAWEEEPSSSFCP